MNIFNKANSKFYLILFILLINLLFAFRLTYGSEYYSPLTEAESTVFYRKLQKEIVKDEDFILAKMRRQAPTQTIETWNVSREIHKNAPSQIDQARLQTMIEVLRVKQQLYKNFYGTNSVNSSAVRMQLVKVFSKDLISEKDLAELQYIVEQEKAKMNRR